jgi:ABC-type polysaccharide/polyol phosphate transport system ATPase subunit
MSAQKQPVIRLRNVSKRFSFTPDSPQSVLETIISVFSRRQAKKQELWAVQDVSFDILPGQAIGIIGRNGSGKSTLLKLIARIIQPTRGEIVVRGRVSALLELGAGFHPDLTGRENIFLNASVLGLTQEETEKLYSEIVAFSELGDFINMPVKHYSSGMYMRLGFSVAIHVRPDILIVDEILAVGDQTFQAKCVDRILDMKQAGVTIVFISHNTATLSILCSDLIWLDQGQVRLTGPTEQVLEQYRETIFRQVGEQISYQNDLGNFKRWGSREVEINTVRVLDGVGRETTIFKTGEPMVVEMHYTAHKPVLEPEFGLAIYRQDGLHVNGPNTRAGGLHMGRIEGPGMVTYRIESLPLLPASYRLTVAVHDSLRPVAYDYHEQAYTFRVLEGGTKESDGIVAFPANWFWHPQPANTVESPQLAGKMK